MFYLSRFVEFCSVVAELKLKIFQLIRGQDGNLFFFKHELVGGHWYIASCQVSLNSVQWLQRSRKCPDQREAKAAFFAFRSFPKKVSNLVENVEFLLPVKFRWIPFRCWRGKVENVSANKKPTRPSWFSDRSEKQKLGRGRWDLSSCQFRWILFSGCKEVENVSVNQRPGRPPWFYDRPEKRKYFRLLAYNHWTDINEIDWK